MQSSDGRWVLWRWKIVSQNTYITRLDIIRTPWFEIKVHWMAGPDPERDPHNHPWPFLSIILHGMYCERRHTSWDTWTLHWHRWFNWSHDMTKAHRIVAVAPKTTTLVITGRRRQEWGFQTKEGFVPWHAYDRR
jgi:hypothetical protein